MRPASGAISPASWPIRVVLPAPLGPMTACSSPFGTQSEMESEAMMPPKRLVSASIFRRGSATARSRQQSVDAAACKQDDQQEQGSEHDLPVFRHAPRGIAEQRRSHDADQHRERLLQRQQRNRADQRAE